MKIVRVRILDVLYNKNSEVQWNKPKQIFQLILQEAWRISPVKSKLLSYKCMINDMSVNASSNVLILGHWHTI